MKRREACPKQRPPNPRNLNRNIKVKTDSKFLISGNNRSVSYLFSKKVTSKCKCFVHVKTVLKDDNGE